MTTNPANRKEVTVTDLTADTQKGGARQPTRNGPKESTWSRGSSEPGAQMEGPGKKNPIKWKSKKEVSNMKGELNHEEVIWI